MTKLEQAARQALDALENGKTWIDIITPLRESLAEQAEQEPVAWIKKNDTCTQLSFERFKEGAIPLYAAPVQQAEQEPVVKPMDKAERENWYKEVIAATEDAIAEKERIAEHRALITRNNEIIAADREKNK